MKIHLRIISIILFYLCFFVNISYSQNEEILSDSAFKAYLNNAWDEIDKSNFNDSLQFKYADELYDYYKKYPDTELGLYAISSAFTMWGNIGAAEKFNKAVAGLDYDSEVWNRAIVSGSNAYTQNGNRTRDEYYSWLQQLKDKLTHPESKSEAILWLARYYNEQGQIDKVITLARELLEINANEFYVEQALGFQQEAENLGIGATAPNFEAKTVTGEKISLSGLKGQIVLLEFWATWCGPCLPEIPHLKTLDSTYVDYDFKIIGIALDSDSTKLKKFLQEEGIDWPQIQQSDEYDDEIARLYNVYGIPRSFIIGGDGTILAKDLRGDELEQEIADLFSE